MKAHAHRPGALSKQRHAVRVSTEVPDVLLDPLEAHQLVKHAGITGSAGVVEAQEPESANPVADGHNYDVIMVGQDLAVVQVECGSAAVEAATVDPDHHG